MGLHLPHHEPDPDLPPRSAGDRLADHAMGVELQLLELAVRRDRADGQHDPAEVARLDERADALRDELARVGERLQAT